MLRPPAQCAVPAGGKEGCTTVLNPPGFGRGVHANDLLQTLLQKIFIRRSSFRVHSFDLRKDSTRPSPFGCGGFKPLRAFRQAPFKA